MTSPTLRLLAAALFLAAAAPLPAPAADARTAYVSMRRVFDEYYKTRRANTVIKARAETAELERKDLVDALKKLKTAFEAQIAEARDKSLSESARDKKKDEAEATYTRLREAEERLERFDRTSQRQFAEEMREKQQELVEEIRAVIARHAREKGFTLVLDVSGKTFNNTEAVVFYDPATEITDAVIEILNRNAPPDAAPATNAPAPTLEKSAP
jgi:outer membrane protein